MQNDCFPDSVAEWPKASMARLADVNPRYRVKKGKEYPFIEMAAVGENFGGILSLDRRVLEGSGLSRFRAGDTLFAKITPCPENGKVAFVSYLPDDVGLGSTEFIVLSPRPGTEPRFLYHLACSHAVRGRAAARMEGSTGRQRVPDEVFTTRLLVPIPESSEQAAIAQMLDAVDSALERIRATLSAAKTVAASLREDAVAGTLLTPARRAEENTAWIHPRLGSIPSGWSVERLAQVCTRIVDGTHQAVETSSSGIPFLYVSCIREGRIVWSNASSISERTYSRISKGREPQIGSVLYTAVGSYGNAALVTKGDPFSFQRHIAILYPKSARLRGGYLAMWLNSSKGKRWSEIHAVGNAQKTVTLTELGKLLIPLPTLCVQEEMCFFGGGGGGGVYAEGVRAHAPLKLNTPARGDLLTGRVRLTRPIEATAS